MAGVAKVRKSRISREGGPIFLRAVLFCRSNDPQAHLDKPEAPLDISAPGADFRNEVRTILGLTTAVACLVSANMVFAETEMPCQRVKNEVKGFVETNPHDNMDDVGRGEMNAKLYECLEKNEVCMAGANDRQGKRHAQIWHAEKFGKPILPKFTGSWEPGQPTYKIMTPIGSTNIPGGDELYFGAVQIPKTRDGSAVCILAKNVFVRAEPWYAEAWRIKENQMENLKLPGYDGKGNIFTATMTPEELTPFLVNMYEYRLAHPPRKKGHPRSKQTPKQTP